MTSEAQGPGDSVWRPPDLIGPPPRRGSVLGPVIAFAVFGTVVGLLLVAAALMGGVGHARLVHETVEVGAAEGPHTVVESGFTADHRAFRVEVAHYGRSAVCGYVYVAAAPGQQPAHGGGGCGVPGPMTFSYGGTGDGGGITTETVATVEVKAPGHDQTAPTKSLPAEYAGRRYFAVVLPAGLRPTELVARAADGSVIRRYRL